MGIISKIRELFGASHSKTAQLEADWLIVGLGNPGAKYANTRHNIGALALEQLLDGETLRSYPGGAPADFAIVEIAGQKVALVRSTTYMNVSGEAVSPLVQHLHVPLDHVIALHDELDLPRGTVRIKQGGNENGHKGLLSISQHLGTREYIRVRIGIGRPEEGTTVSDYVLGALPSDDTTHTSIERAAQAARAVVADGLAQAQQTFHGK
ncbi:aminoacyl-tRNA hydrolase [Corynebacterium pseudopelargi]|uniref:Peptidyl-tRNA hydrolase n=1 Tax=Corynebacterium pseudopelargi TaxID=2080757 RepID=A0A3G6IV99_9CORY|nr:aminoacyl-tRNA hydrolase [Corynebacterium pseudopelargi]AZA09632.1 Peptidyl-tRNA hydrolase [Corynebacterium pseudopelargi]